MPAKSEFTAFLRRTLHESVDKGYSKWALTQEEALALRVMKDKEPDVGRPEDVLPAVRITYAYTFFPQQQRRSGLRCGGR